MIIRDLDLVLCFSSSLHRPVRRRRLPVVQGSHWDGNEFLISAAKELLFFFVSVGLFSYNVNARYDFCVVFFNK